MYVLMPGRHLALTHFQFDYLKTLVENGLSAALDLDGKALPATGPLEGLIFAVTSANHHDTRRNPVPYALRVLALNDFAQALRVPAWIYGIEDVGVIPDFPAYVLRRVSHLSEGRFMLTPKNTAVAVSTDTFAGWERLGFPILPVERHGRAGGWMAPLPGDLVAAAGTAPRWQDHPLIGEHLHGATFAVWENYRVGDTIRRLWRDPILGDDGDLTATRDYGSYVRGMDENAGLKYRETAPHVRPGRIGDIGCAVGSWIKQAAADPRHRECEFYGVEVVRALYDICEQRKQNGDFATPWVFFAMRNAVNGGVFEAGSMNTIHTSSLTHEIFSYGSMGDLKAFLKHRFDELRPGGVWVNRDVVGPEDGGRPVILELSTADGSDVYEEHPPSTPKELETYLASRSTRVKFLHFAKDFRPGMGEPFPYEMLPASAGSIEGPARCRLTLAQACEFIYKKDYPDNWKSEMHERFCFWSYGDWVREMEAAGFRLTAASHAWRNDWMVANRFTGRVKLLEEQKGELVPLDFPVTHMTIVAERVS